MPLARCRPASSSPAFTAPDPSAPLSALPPRPRIPCQVVVDTEQTAKALLAHGQLRQRVTIIPLNK